MFYQILKGFYTSNLFETCFMVANDDLEGKTTNFTGSYTHTISGPKIPKPTIVNVRKLLFNSYYCNTNLNY